MKCVKEIHECADVRSDEDSELLLSIDLSDRMIATSLDFCPVSGLDEKPQRHAVSLG